MDISRCLVPILAKCPGCDGLGEIDDEKCNICHGTGWAEMKITVQTLFQEMNVLTFNNLKLEK